jgi:SnoaL-like domain
MEVWEVVARESIRDLVARYNANGDAGRVPQVLELFAPDAVMELGDPGSSTLHTGREEIALIFTGTKDRWTAEATDRGAPPYVRHCVSTHQIDLRDQTHAVGRCYFFVIMDHGLDHWGRYLDEYGEVEGQWRFTRRTVRVDGRTATG